MGFYWDGTGSYQSVIAKLEDIVGDPLRTHRAFEKLRRAKFVYYDLYNNGLTNRFSEVRSVLGVTPRHYGVTVTRLRTQPNGFEDFYQAVEKRMDQIVLAAADTAKLMVDELSAHERMERALKWL